MRMKKSIRVKKSARVKRSPRFAEMMSARTMWMTVIGVMGAAVVIGALQSSQPTDPAALDARAESVAAAQAQAKKAAASTTPVAGAVPATTLAMNTTGPNLPAVDAAAQAAVPKTAPVTISGCLEQADEAFRLKDTTGVDLPKWRSWKTGFLKKGPGSIALVDAPKKLKLPDHVGERVSVTGMMVKHEMQVRSLQRVAASCS